MSWVNIISILISLAALCVGAYSLYLQRKDKKPVLKISVEISKRLSTVSYDTSTGRVGQKELPFLVILLTNPKEKEIRVFKLCFRVNDGKSFNLDPDREMPFPSLPERQQEVLVSGKKLLNDLVSADYKAKVKGRVEVYDEVGRCFKSAWIKIVFDKLAED